MNTGLIDERWQCIKGWLPDQLAASNGVGEVNPDLWTYVYQWWFRNHYPKVQDRVNLLAKHWATTRDS